MSSILTRWRWQALCALVPLAVITSPVAADAHPLGSPLGAQLAADGDTVTVSWIASEDDWVSLGHTVGALPTPPGTITAFQAIRRSPAVRDYLLAHISVTQAGTRCTGEVGSVPDDAETFLGKGMPLTFTCPAEVAAVDVQITALTDVDERYRTKAIAEAEPGEVIYTKSNDTHRWDFGTTATKPWSGWVPLIIAVAAAGVVGRIGWLLRARAAGTEKGGEA
ncbi:hypothetical protein FHU38_000895 [Saccharomonospora amisosensis]|uniref:Uncharacterized protein n=1 Tax=Saccharomonospora amisosensis TaxID=1128677 RepID=A0A7X5UM44_9PSEU|nr:hypothetical protein [Saccharomonospora amisosensis]NIJ10551.1 hypothetical protein [Saccharomonospora amisosensis]